MREVLHKKATETPKRSQDIRRLSSTKSSNPVTDRFAILQRSIGNSAVEHLYRSGALQAKLRIGRPNDSYEQEADRVADQVMRMPETAVDSRQSIVNDHDETVQRKPG